MTPPSQTPSERTTSPIDAAVQHGITLFAVCVFAKLWLVAERHGAAGLQPPGQVALYLYRDAVVGLAWAAVAGSVTWFARWVGLARSASWVLRGGTLVAAIWIGLNIPFFRAFSTPLNRGLLAMSGPLHEVGESAVGMATFDNLLPIGMSLAVAVGFLGGLEALRRRRGVNAHRAPGVAATGAALAVLVGGWIGPRDIKPRGLDRNALWEATALLLPVGSAAESDPRHQADAPLPRGSVADPGARRPDLGHLRGAAEGMNVVLVVLESTSASYVGAWGADPDPTPRLSAIADQALVFDAWYSPTPTSMKSLFSLMCATYPYPRPTAETYLVPRLPCRSLPEQLAASGRRSTLVHSGRFSYYDKLAFFADRGFDSMHDAESLPASEGTHRDGWGIEESAALAQMERFLDDVDGEPFFLMYVPIYPHHPYSTPPGIDDRFGTRRPFDRYRSALAYSDDAVGALFDALAERDLLSDTLFVALGDHGEAFAQHPGNRVHASAVYDENVRVPALIANPTLFPEPVRYPAPADHTDLAPTLLEMLGLDVPGRWQGRSLLGGARDPARFFADYSFLLLGLRDGPWKYIHAAQSGAHELYDLREDPGETVDQSAEHPELVARFEEHLEWWYHRQAAIMSDYDAYLGEGTTEEAGVFLEHLVPVHVEQRRGRVHTRRAMGNRPLNIAGQPYETGLGTHAPSVIRYELDRQYTLLQGAVGRDHGAYDGLVEAEVWLDGERVFASGPLRRETSARRFEISLVGAETLELRTLDAGDGTRGDAVTWVDARLY